MGASPSLAARFSINPRMTACEVVRGGRFGNAIAKKSKDEEDEQGRHIALCATEKHGINVGDCRQGQRLRRKKMGNHSANAESEAIQLDPSVR